MQEADLLAKVKKEKVMSLATGDAIKVGSAGFVSGGVGAYVGHTYSPRFRTSMSLSAKTSIPLMIGIFAFTLQFENTMHGAQYFPEKYGIIEKKSSSGSNEILLSTMPFHHRILNYLYDHPFQFIAATGFPLATFIVKEQLKLPNLKFSQRIMHSRVYAQGGILCILLSTMAFREYMDKNGRFPEPLLSRMNA